MKKLVLTICLVIPVVVFAKEKIEIGEPTLNAPNPIGDYVGVRQQGEGKDVRFIFCDKSKADCQLKRTAKILDYEGGGAHTAVSISLNSN